MSDAQAYADEQRDATLEAAVARLVKKATAAMNEWRRLNQMRLHSPLPKKASRLLDDLDRGIYLFLQNDAVREMYGRLVEQRNAESDAGGQR